ncbi:MAG TPA: AraC family transcriptional regulator [Candidatus Sulfotelmatobacter sp.]|nr:AraC family transcriptional regulator [Candidatus Sulfotelmatobacter sp.]
MSYDLHGGTLARTFRLEEPPTLVSTSSERHRMSVSELRYDQPGFGFSVSLPLDEAYLVGLQLRSVAKHELWLDGRSVPVTPIGAGTTHFYDLERDPVCYTDQPFHDLFFYLPKRALAELSEELGTGPISHLTTQDGVFIDDPIVRGLGMALQPVLLHGLAHHEQLLVDHVMLALRAHLVGAYKGARIKRTPRVYGLSSSNERTAKEMMREHIREGIPLQALADACNLSVSSLIRGFRASTGSTPHQWLTGRRLDMAVELMRRYPQLALVDIALQSGFADQSHFTRVFTSNFGVSPAVWRKRV